MALDVPSFAEALRDVAEGLPCVTGRISTRQAAVVHRLEGLRLYTLGAEGSALRSLQQAQSLDPLYRPPEAMVRPGSALESLWNLARTAAPSPWLATVAPEGVSLAVDGTIASTRPAALPSIVQVATPTGAVLWTRYVPGGSSLPDLSGVAQAARARAAAALPPAQQLYLAVARRQARRDRRIGMLLGGVVALTVSGAFYVDNANAAADYRDPITPHADLPAMRQRANRSATASSLFLMGGVGLFGAAFLVP